ncbi:hypothetical protein BDZ91DRAFT_778412 [Kalaharituber pfeilii]|nr:hypothetical protein BDZ91DRAFT_778412 [Kalaharituber pfeilii]
MSVPPENIYGTKGDTSFRKKYDREEYARLAAEREATRRESKPGLHKHRREPTPPSSAHTTARTTRLNLEENLNKTTLVPAGAGVGKRGRGAGFYCDACDLTFKDSLQWVDHLNSKQHLYATGQTGEVERATLEDVRKRLEWLREKKRQEQKELAEGGVIDLQKRLAERVRIEEEERIARREKRKEKRRIKKEKASVIRKEHVSGDKEMTEASAEEEIDPDTVAMAKTMGFSGAFGTTKKG